MAGGEQMSFFQTTSVGTAITLLLDLAGAARFRPDPQVLRDHFTTKSDASEIAVSGSNGCRRGFVSVDFHKLFQYLHLRENII